MQRISSMSKDSLSNLSTSDGAAAGMPKGSERSEAGHQPAQMPCNNAEERLYALQDDLGMMLAQNARRKDVERMRPRVSDETESILEEDREERLARLARVVKSGNQSLRDFLRQARRLFPDDSDLVLALRARGRMPMAAPSAGPEGASTSATLDNAGAAALLDRAIDNVFQNGDARHIKAGINAATQARRYGERLNMGARLLRQLYREFLDFVDALPDLYDDWIERFDYDQRIGLTRYVSETLTADRRAVDPSCTQEVFSALIVQCNVLRMMTAAERLLVQLAPVGAPPQDRGDLERQMAGLLTTMMRDPTEVKLAVGMLCTRSRTLNERERFVQRVYRAFAALPIALYPDIGHRQTILSDVLGLATPHF
ncbi:hypothetical protein OVY01_08205 [Robbsia sp. Bb-Pol-6]|uniref:Hypersensitivity response secretion-like HrpJ domain-containing protein n=1 Tax=Robbsia betulipollinis TaxID=2981849 RepID=A0ABT3ZL07_9BURK|nr:HrpJ domain-containing protein [Robbsia betulipollinis]MCY0387214.1 hypothetical protein [Robbsia betulipollinis]